jgi:hypothetical protein
VNLENELREALRREPAPADFAAEVLAKARALSGHNTAQTAHWWRRPATLALAAGLAAAAIIPSVIEYRERRRGIEARDQLVIALNITRVRLQQTKEKIRRNTRHTL